MNKSEIRKHLIKGERDKLLLLLQKSDHPLLERDLLNLAGMDEYELGSGIALLRSEGYDIKVLREGKKRKYLLIRFGEITGDNYYRTAGEFNTPILLTSCWHIGSVGFSVQAYKELVRDVERYKVTTVLHLGDLIQGRGIHRMESKDLSEPKIEKQIDIAIQYLDNIPCPKKLMLGNHEEKLMGMDIGLNTPKIIAEGSRDTEYCGTVAKFLVNGKYTLLAMHGKGMTAYAKSYYLQKIWRELIERPNILTVGHLHYPLIQPDAGHRMLIVVPTLQRESSYLIWQGITSQVGWIILTHFNGEEDGFIIRRPVIY